MIELLYIRKMFFVQGTLDKGSEFTSCHFLACTAEQKIEIIHIHSGKLIENAHKTRGSFPGEEAALKLLYLALKNVGSRWQACRDWRLSLNHFTLLWGDRIELAQSRPTR